MINHRSVTRPLVGLIFFCSALGAESETKVPKFSNSIRADIKLMWQTVPMSGERGKRASSERAIEAAHRVFTTVPLVGLSRQEIIQLLGDPRKSSDSIYNFPFYPAARSQLVYRFDTGSGGWQFNFTFDRRDCVSKVNPLGIE
jgi:hypothetical protein